MTRDFQLKLKILIFVSSLVVIVHILNMYMDYRLVQFGIFPRATESLPYIFTAPFIHGNLTHLLNNMTGLVIFSGLCLLRTTRFYLFSSFFIITTSGILVWLFARPAVHVGASGWIFGLWSLSIALAWFDRRLINILIAMFVILFYGGMVFGVLPGNPYISFESHLAGAFSGVVCAMLVARRKIPEKN